MAFSWRTVAWLAEHDVPDEEALVARLEKVVESYFDLPTQGDAVLTGNVNRICADLIEPVASKMLRALLTAYNRGVLTAAADLIELGIPKAIACSATQLEDLAPVLETVVETIDATRDSLQHHLLVACRQFVDDRERYRADGQDPPGLILGSARRNNGSDTTYFGGWHSLRELFPQAILAAGLQGYVSRLCRTGFGYVRLIDGDHACRDCCSESMSNVLAITRVCQDRPSFEGGIALGLFHVSCPRQLNPWRDA